MEAQVIKPRCPQCRKVVAEWLKGEAGYRCPRCHLYFTLDTDKEKGLTNILKYANTANSVKP